MASGAQADELADLKAQLEALQARVNTLETAQPTALPDGVSMITFSRGQGSLQSWGSESRRFEQGITDRGFTISVTPTADMPAPVAEVVVYGYVKGDVIYDFDYDLGDSFYVPSIWSNAFDDEDHIRLHARQSRFGIKSKVDTAIGQIRAKIEGDFFGADSLFRLRHAYGEWDMTPNWTLMVGQNWMTAALLPIGITTVDFSGDAGPTYTRRAQVRVTYHDGPLSWAVAIERPTFQSDTNWPNVSAYFQYDIAGGHQFIVTGTVADWDDQDPFDDSHLGWAVQAGANINLADVAYLTVGGIYGDREPCNSYLNQVGAWCGLTDADKGGLDDWFPKEAYGVVVGLSFNINDTTSFNVEWGWSHIENELDAFEGIDSVDVMTVHANILWQPVSQMRLGWEVMWGQYDFDAGAGFCTVDPFCTKDDEDAWRAQVGAWFFF
jgi:opacity protein-like surface antigen